MSDEVQSVFREWSILELLGHVTLAGLVSEEERFGAKLGRIDIPGPGDTMTTQYFSAGSIYRLTPTTETIARAVARQRQPEPVHRWELPALPAPDEPTPDGPDDDPDEGYPF